MRKSFKLWSGLLGALLAATAMRATTSHPAFDRYYAIPERNAFGLKPREEPAPPAAPTKPLRKLLLTGITTLLGTKRALLKAEPLPGYKDEKEQSLILTEGQRQDEIEVVWIDEHAGRVMVDNSGTLMMLSFQKDAPKLRNSAPPTHGVPVPSVPQPGALPPPVPSATGGPPLDPGQLIMPQ